MMLRLRVNSHSSSPSSSSCPSSSTSTPQKRLPSVPEDGFDCDVSNVSSSQTSHDSDSTTTELIKEISTLEVEVMQLEQYLLSLYRTAFENHLSSLPSVVVERGSRTHLQSKTGSQVLDVTKQCKEDIDIQRGGRLQQSLSFPVAERDSVSYPQSKTGAEIEEATTESSYKEDIDVQRGGRLQSLTSSVSDSAGSDNQRYFSPSIETSKRGHKNAGSDFRSLADHLGASLSNQIPKNPSKLSEDIIRCISNIYCKFADPTVPYTGMSVSPTSSFTSSSMLSTQNDCDSWSPRCNEEDISRTEGLKEMNGPYSKMVEVPKIALDDDRFNYAETKLRTYRSLIKHLEKVKPRKMKHEEKLAFWINIYNALVMHANLAYGIHRNRMKSTPLVLKASYNVGGNSVNADTIKTSILGCHHHSTASRLHTFFLPGTKIQSGNDKHAYAIDCSEPLVHFALCSGAYSDPAVRLYRSKSVLDELQFARDQFIQASFSVYKRKKIILPKILYNFAKDASVNLDSLVEMMHACLSEPQRKAMQRCQKGRPDKYIEWSSYNTSFRYIIHRELAKGRTSIYE